MHRGVRGPSHTLRGKSYIFIRTWNKTCAIELGFKMPTDDIMNLIEEKGSTEGAAAHYTSRQTTYDKKSKDPRYTTSTRKIRSTCHSSSTAEQGRRRRQTQQNRKQWTRRKERKESENGEHRRRVSAYPNQQWITRSNHKKTWNIDEAHTRLHHGNTPCHLVNGEQRQQRTLHESRSTD